MTLERHACGCTPTAPCAKARRLFETRNTGGLMTHLAASLVGWRRPSSGPIGQALVRLRRENRARARVGAP